MHSTKEKDIILKYKKEIITLAYLQDIDVVYQSGLPSGCAAQQVNEHCDIYLHLEGVDLKKEIQRMSSRKSTLNGLINELKLKISLPDYHLVPENIQEQNKQKLQGYEQELQNVSVGLSTLEGMLNTK